MRLGEFFDEGQSESGAGGFARGLGADAVELFEDFFALAVRDTGAVVLDFDEDEPAVGSGADCDGFIRGITRVFDGVVGDVLAVKSECVG